MKLANGWRELPEWVFVDSAGDQLDKDKIRKRFDRLMKVARLSGHVPYDLRHTFATTLLANGAPITYVSAQLGHTKPSMTLLWYSHWLPTANKGYVDALDDSPTTTARVV